MTDQRLGKRNGLGELELSPSQTISGGALPPKPYETIGLENGYFVVLDQQISNEDERALVLELQGIIQSYAAPKKTSKTVEPSE